MMPDEHESALTSAILSALRAAGKDLTALTPHDLAPVDQFHNGGTWATRKLTALAEMPDGARVLDVGGGIGGPARTLATEFGARVTVVDRSPAFCRTGAELTARLGRSERVDFIVGTGASLPVRSESVDTVLLQNSAMNIADKEGLAAEIFRVLRPGGRCALQEVMNGPVEPIRFPTPWAIDPAESFTRMPDEARRTLADAGFREITWLDASDLIRSWVRARIGRSPGTPPIPPLTSFTMPPETCEAAISNMWRNDEEGRTVTIWAVLEKPAGDDSDAGAQA
ncbi:MAG TPA: class I SAM-dependent methyltransferase [Nitrolancea sp.]|nr:class I SAM-dependent methyltransferase [Nitrolancea sp.]